MWQCPGLTEEGALIGARQMDSSLNTVRVLCTDSGSGEWTKVTDGEGNEWQYIISWISCSWVDGEARCNNLDLLLNVLGSMRELLMNFHKRQRSGQTILRLCDLGDLIGGVD